MCDKCHEKRGEYSLFSEVLCEDCWLAEADEIQLAANNL